MVPFIKKFSTTINYQFQMVILAVLSIVTLYVYLSSVNDFLDFIIAFLPIALVLLAVWLLYLDKKVLESYIIIFLLVFANGLSSFVEWLFSYHFSLEAFLITFHLNILLLLLGSLYLGIMIVSYMMNQGLKLELKKMSHLLLILLFALYLYLSFGFVNLLLNALIIVLAMSASNKYAMFALMLRVVIASPFVIIERFVDKLAKFTTIHDWLMNAFEIALIVLMVLAIIPLFTKKKVEQIE